MPGPKRALAHVPDDDLRTSILDLTCKGAGKKYGVSTVTMANEARRLGIELRRGRPGTPKPIAVAKPSPAQPVRMAGPPPVSPRMPSTPLAPKLKEPAAERIDRLLEIPKQEIGDRLRFVRAQDLAVELRCTFDDMLLLLKFLRLDPDPKPAPLPEHTTWRPELDQSYPRLIEQGVPHDDAVARIEAAVRWAVRWGCMHVDAAGALVREMDPVRLARPAEWRP